jgi:hypothetical protein
VKRNSCTQPTKSLSIAEIALGYPVDPLGDPRSGLHISQVLERGDEVGGAPDFQHAKFIAHFDDGCRL